MGTNALCIFLMGDAELASRVPFGDGLRCAGGQLLRLATKTAVQGWARFPDFAAGDPSIQARAQSLGAPIPPGATRVYQTYYRDVAASFCPPPAGGAFNVTNGVRIVWP
jgi:hypothetical protein